MGWLLFVLKKGKIKKAISENLTYGCRGLSLHKLHKTGLWRPTWEKRLPSVHLQDQIGPSTLVLFLWCRYYKEWWLLAWYYFWVNNAGKTSASLNAPAGWIASQATPTTSHRRQLFHGNRPVNPSEPTQLDAAKVGRGCGVGGNKTNPEEISLTARVGTSEGLRKTWKDKFTY